MIKKILYRILIVIVLFAVVAAGNIAFFIKKSKVVSEGEPISAYNSTNCALLIVDIQEGTTGRVSPDQCYKDVSEELISNSNKIIKKALEKGAPVIYIKNEVTNPIINFLDNSMAAGSIGAELDKRLKVVSEHIVPKQKQDAFSNPTLDDILKEHKINKLYIVGLDAAHCVYTTIRAAKNREYRVTVIEEAVISENEELKEEMLNKYFEENVQVISISEFIN